MSRELLNTTLGVYFPAFFCMNLNIPFDFKNLENNNEKQMSTFIHEYIHYLQDITTTYGYMNMSHSVKIIQVYLNKVAIDENLNIKLPKSFNDVENAEERNYQISIFTGDYEYTQSCYIDCIKYKDDDLYKEFFGEGNENIEKCKKIELHYHSNSTYSTYNFGSMCIMESMAYMIESHIYPDEVRYNEFPYNTCELVTRFIYPEFAKIKKNIVALCDVSLMTQNPGETFYMLLCYMESIKMMPSDVTEIYDLALINLHPNYLKDFNLEVLNAQDEINFLYPEDQEFTQNINIFLKKIVSEASDVRKNKCGYFSKLMEMDKDNSIKFIFTDIIPKFALPVIVDKNFNLYMYNNNDLDLTLFLVVKALYDLFLNIKTGFKCYLFEICDKISDLCNENCLNSPWKMSEREPLCPFAQFWYRFSLEGKELID